MKQTDKLISVVVPILNEAGDLAKTLDELYGVLSEHFEQFEIILVDNGSSDNTPQVAESIMETLPGIRYLRLSRTFGTETAMAAGIDQSIGDYCATFLPGVDPPAVLPPIIDRCQKSRAIVLGQATNAVGPSWPWRYFQALYYYLVETWLRLHPVRGATLLCALDRNTVTHLGRTRDKFRFLLSIHDYLGIPIEVFPYKVHGERKENRWSSGVWKTLNASLDLIVLNSVRPLRLVSFSSIALSFLNLSYILYIALIYFFKEDRAEGWVTTSFQSAVNFFLLFLSLSVVLEYLGRLLSESKDRPLYFVVEEKHSQSRVTNVDLKNTLSESTDGMRKSS